MTAAIVAELKNELTELGGISDRLRAKLPSAQDQWSAFVRVISATIRPLLAEATTRGVKRADDFATAFSGIIGGN